MMEVLKFVGVVIVALLASSSTFVRSEEDDASPPPAPAPGPANSKHPCGSILTEAHGALQYKPFEQANSNERCVWIIRVPSASGYNITLYNLGYGGTFDTNALHLTGVGSGKDFTKQIVPTQTDVGYYINGSLVVLTYYSGGYRTGRGFSLFWTTDLVTDTSRETVVSATEIVSSVSKNISHPMDTTGLENYQDNELSAFLFAPEFSGFQKNKEAIEIRFVQLGLEGYTCNDYINIFILNPEYATTGWKTHGRFCGPDTDVTFTASDIVLLVFHSNANINGTGFDLIYQRKEIKGKFKNHLSERY